MPKCAEKLLDYSIRVELQVHAVQQSNFRAAFIRTQDRTRPESIPLRFTEPHIVCVI